MPARRAPRRESAYAPLPFLPHLPRLLEHLANIRAAAGDAQDSMIPLHHEVYRDVLRAMEYPPEREIAEISNPLRLDVERLRAERRPRPRIFLCPHVTSRENLAVSWAPFESGKIESDYLSWPGVRHAAFERPPNELLFIRQVGSLRHRTSAVWRTGKPDFSPDLMGAVKLLFDRLLERLDAIAEVYLTALPSVSVDPQTEVPVSFRVTSMHEIDRKLIMEKIENFPGDMDRFREIVVDVLNGDRNEIERASRRLRKAGFDWATPKPTELVIQSHDTAVALGLLEAEPMRGAEVSSGLFHERSPLRLIPAGRHTLKA